MEPSQRDRINSSPSPYGVCPICRGDRFSVVGHAEDFLTTHEGFTLLQCDDCGLVRTAEPPLGEEMARYYQSPNYTAHTGELPFASRIYRLAQRHMMRRKRLWIERMVPIKRHEPTPHLLDVGAGMGHFAYTMQQAGYIVETVEPNEPAQRYAKKFFRLSPYESLEGAPFTENQFDLITLWHVLEHLPNLDEIMLRLRTLLKPGGKLVLALPNRLSFDALHYGDDWAAYDVPRHLWHFTPTQIERLAEQYDFDLAPPLPMPLDAYYISLLSERNRGRSFPTDFLAALRIGFKSHMRAKKDPLRGSSMLYELTLRK